MSVEIEGVIRHVIAQNGDWAAAVICAEKTGADISVAGDLAGAKVGDKVCVIGEWTTYRGRRQIKVSGTIPVADGVDGIRAFLSSGYILNVGPETAKAIVDMFGEKTAFIIENEPDRLLEVPGVGPARRDSLVAAWASQEEFRALFIFLAQHEIKPTFARKLFEKYGVRAASVIRKNPYILAREMYGVGFRTADDIAKKMGIPASDIRRAIACVLYVLEVQICEDGHTCFDEEYAINDAIELMVDEKRDLYKERAAKFVLDAVDKLLADGAIHAIDVGKNCMYIAHHRLHQEMEIARWARNRQWDGQILDVPAEHGHVTLNEKQAQAVRLAFSAPLSILTGGPGVGKTTTVRAIVRYAEEVGQSVILAAPTGKAAKRMEQTSGRGALTVHRLLGYDGSVFHAQKDKVQADLIVIDESSMLDAWLTCQLIRGVHETARILLVGDANQLPSVGPGAVLDDLIASEAIPVTTLDVVYRQAAESGIVTNAYRIFDGEYPVTADDFDIRDKGNFSAEAVVNMVTKQLPDMYDVDLTDIQILAPMHAGDIGIENVNAAFQRRLTQGNPGVETKFKRFHIGDRVIQTRNDYDTGVMNGDVGHIVDIETLHDGKVVWVKFEGKYDPVYYPLGGLGAIRLAYCISIHKSQGSEWPLVVVLMSKSHWIMLERNLLYTAVTRAADACVLVGQKRAIRRAVENDEPRHRATMLYHLLTTHADML